MARKKKHPEHVNHERWLVSYADFMTLLFAFFVVMFASSQVDTNKLGRFTESFSKSVGIEPFSEGGPSLLAGNPPASEASDPGPTLAVPASALEAIRNALTERALTSKALGAVEFVPMGNELVLRLPVSALFGVGDDRLSPDVIPALTAIADEIRDRPVELRVEGHTDDRPIHTSRFRSNWELSALRATAVIGALRKYGRIEPARLSAVGYGEFHPLADNATYEGRSKNRRVDLVLRIKQEPEPQAEATPAAAPETKPDTKPEPEHEAEPEAAQEPEKHAAAEKPAEEHVP